MYDYYEAVFDDVRDAVLDDYYAGKYDRDTLETILNDDLFINDSVTGNASGSYFCNAWRAEEAIAHNWDLLKEAYETFGYSEIPLDSFSPEAADVTIRCYLLPGIIADVLDDLEETAPETFKE